MRDTAELKLQFSVAPEFAESPLYTALAPIVAANERLLRLAARTRRGQYPTFLFFAAVHDVLLGGAEHELGQFYPSIVGDRARAARDAGPAFVAFCTAHEDELGTLLEQRLVQTNAVPRSLALKLGFFALGRFESAPVHLIEIGASAGIHLRFDRYGYALGRHRFGNRASPVQVSATWIGKVPPPDIDAAPALASATGIDLNPLDATSPDDRRWLQALVWPDNLREARLLRAALGVIAADPPSIRRGEAALACPQLAAHLPPAEPRLVFTAATRMHVPPDELGAFDAAIATLGQNAPLYHLTLERALQADIRPQPVRRGGALYLRDPSGRQQLIAVAGHRIDWIEPMQL